MRLVLASIALLLCSAALLLGPRTSEVVRAALGGAAFVLFAWALYDRRSAPRTSTSYLDATDQELVRVTPEGATSVITWAEPFGVTLLASYGRKIAVLAFTTPTGTRYVPVRIDGQSETDDLLFARVAVLSDLDLVDGAANEPALSTIDTATILRHIERRDPKAHGRIYLSDGHGAPISLDGATLVIRGKNFDLTSALEWRPLMFHESTGQSAPLYQATWIKQGTEETVLVAPMPASVVPREANIRREATGKLGRALSRDLRLLQAPSELPPPRDMRVAIDRPFMIAVRRALADAPLATRVFVESPASRSRTERRGSIV